MESGRMDLSKAGCLLTEISLGVPRRRFMKNSEFDVSLGDMR